MDIWKDHSQSKRTGAFVWVVGLTLACVVLTSCALLTLREVECPVLGPDETGYQNVPDWLRFPPPGRPDWAFDLGVAGVGVDSSGLVYVSHRGYRSPRLTVWNPDGSFNRVFPAPESVRPHYVELDEEDNVWWVDDRGYCIRRMTQDGEILMTLGECGAEGDDEYHFSGVTDIGWDGEGNFFVTDGDRKNRRVLKYDKDGTFLTKWGSKGSGPGQFDYPHSLWVDPDGTVMVCDRNNGRIQVFDKDGNLQEIWTHIVGRPYQIVKNKDGDYFVSDGFAGRVAKFNRDGEVLDSFECKRLIIAHSLAICPNGDLITGTYQGWVERWEFIAR